MSTPAQQQLRQLLQKVADGKATEAEQHFVARYWAAFESASGGMEIMDDAARQALDAELLQKINTRIFDLESAAPRGIVRTMWQRAAAVAAVLILVAGATWFVVDRNKTESPAGIARTTDVAAPTGNKATITLANGKRIVLDQVGAGSLAAQGIASAAKTADGGLVYNGTVEQISYQTLSNPKASQPIRLTLADGSVVYLNAASSITYPDAFTGKERMVTISGEAYFEVTHNAAQPFRVKAGNQLIEDVGTAFNVNAYSDEPQVLTTLVEGEVRINNAVTLKPEQQYNGTAVVKADLEQVLAWKDGLFSFSHTDLMGVLHQLEKWYDLEVVIEGHPRADTFGGSLQRSLSLAKVLKMLEQQGVHFRTEGRKLIVSE